MPQHLMHENVKPAIEDAIGTKRAAAAMQAVADGQQTGDAVLRIIPTAHTSELIVTNLPKSKLVLQEDHYRPVFDGPPTHLFGNTVSFLQNVDALGLDIDTMLSAHGAKQEKWSVLRNVLNSGSMEVCRYDRAICRDQD